MEDDHTATLAVFAMLAVTAPALVVSDLRERRLPNPLTLTLLGAGVLLTLAALAGVISAPRGHGAMAALAIVGFGLVAGLLGVIGMGDAKLIAAVALLTAPVHPLAPLAFLAITAGCGGALAVAALAGRTLRGRPRVPPSGQCAAALTLPRGAGSRRQNEGLPYGVAIVAGGLASVLITGWTSTG